MADPEYCLAGDDGEELSWAVDDSSDKNIRKRSPRRRSPTYHSGRRSPGRRWSPPSNRNTGIGKPGKNLYVAGFSYGTTERDLERKFSKFGRVTDVRVVRDRRLVWFDIPEFGGVGHGVGVTELSTRLQRVRRCRQKIGFRCHVATFHSVGGKVKSSNMLSVGETIHYRQPWIHSPVPCSDGFTVPCPWSWRFSSNGVFTSKSAYMEMLGAVAHNPQVPELEPGSDIM
ncbi:Serine/arginine-rich splicing factor RS2Z32 [Platanthera zijinensis]|uniref:Serine/arginine-rich splicing factor RS2Z32 n=1 Tax=Platanthera zijinensis TaxID=2320716 RepID=A0AAP0BX63_9ASPA